MKYQKKISLVHTAIPGNGISDKSSFIAYSQLEDIFSDLDRAFEDYTTPITCVSFSLRNTVSSAIFLCYFLSRKLSFFLVTPTPLQEEIVPAFCDKVLVIKDEIAVLNDLDANFELLDNPVFITPEYNQGADQGYVYFCSSGSTGQSKFVCYEPDKLIQNAQNCVKRFMLTPQSRVLVSVPINHMYGLGAGFLPAILAGSDVCLIENNNVIKLNDQLLKFKPDVTLLTPAVCKMLLLLHKSAGRSGIFITAGEKLAVATRVEFENCYGCLINLYGCTELGAVATSGDSTGSGGDLCSQQFFPLDGVTIKAGSQENPAEILCIHQAGFLHYADQKGNPMYGDYFTDNWYQTGDAGIYNMEENAFTVLGRIDDCVNRAGFLFSLQEVETVIEGLFPQLEKVVVLRKNEETWQGPFLLAVVVLKKNSELSLADIKAICRLQMLKYMVPDEFVSIAEIPRLSSGKPDRRTLKNKFVEII